MTAKEMFEKLGYEYKEYEGQISYTKWKKDWVDDEYYTVFVDFDLQEKTIDAPFGITLELLQAINKQVEELGWNK